MRRFLAKLRDRDRCLPIVLMLDGLLVAAFGLFGVIVLWQGADLIWRIGSVFLLLITFLLVGVLVVEMWPEAFPGKDDPE